MSGQGQFYCEVGSWEFPYQQPCIPEYIHQTCHVRYHQNIGRQPQNPRTILRLNLQNWQCPESPPISPANPPKRPLPHLRHENPALVQLPLPHRHCAHYLRRQFHPDLNLPVHIQPQHVRSEPHASTLLQLPHRWNQGQCVQPARTRLHIYTQYVCSHRRHLCLSTFSIQYTFCTPGHQNWIPRVRAVIYVCLYVCACACMFKNVYDVERIIMAYASWS